MFLYISSKAFRLAFPVCDLRSFSSISPFDRNAANEIIHAIRDSDLGVNPNDDGKVIRIVLPALTEDDARKYRKEGEQ